MDKAFVWVYTKDGEYHPGSKAHHNPRKCSLRIAGAKIDHYAFIRRDGSKNFDTYENELEKLEKASDAIFRKLRSHQMITQQEKETFASYIFCVFKRVPKSIERLQSSFPRIYASVSSEILDWLDEEEATSVKGNVAQLTRIHAIRDEVQDILEFYRKNLLDSEIRLAGMVAESRLGIPEIMAGMAWQFFVAPLGYGYITGDNPVFTPGLNKPYSEVSFPIATDVALVMSWHNVQQGFIFATPEIVKEINQRTANNAQYELYYSCSERWVVDLAKIKRDGYYLIYPQPMEVSYAT